ncbi:MAG: hypothetical protein HQL27_08435 [Candidatus Omnitrophica bacterium]|nr:hypothetical protein [Candidatus Omnitrophota bacterium]
MNKEYKNLYVFGYGLTLFILFFMSLSVLKYFFPGMVIFLIAVFILYVLNNIERLKLIYNLLLCFFGYLIIQGTDLSPMSIMFLLLSVIIFWITSKDVQLLSGFYRKWMALAHFIGTVVTLIVLGMLFYVVFAPVGIILRIIKKDLLDRSMDGKKESYWIKKEDKPFNAKNYTKQY